MVAFEVPEVDYTRYSNRQLALVPLAVLAVALAILVGWSLFVTGSPTSPGAPATLGIEFTGGTELTVSDASRSEIEATFDQEIESVRPIRSSSDTFIVTFQTSNTDAIESQAEDASFTIEGVSGTSPSFGSQTQGLALIGVVVAFAGMSVLAFVLFRTFVPSIAIVISAFSDIVIPVALMNLFGIKLSLGTVAALLMLIGYSVDSDILLNNHVLRRSGGFYESAYRAMRTGVTMTLTSLSAMTVMTIVAYLFGIDLLWKIGLVLVFGLTADLMNTYMLNMSLLRWYKYEGVAR